MYGIGFSNIVFLACFVTTDTASAQITPVPSSATEQANCNKLTLGTGDKLDTLTKVQLYYGTTISQPHGDRLKGSRLRTALEQRISGNSNHFAHTYRCVWTILEEVDRYIRSRDYVVEVYTGKKIHRNMKDQGSSTISLPTGVVPWNREHVWPLALLKNPKLDPRINPGVATDVHHILPSDKKENNIRADKFFVDTGATGLGYEPRDEVKGQLARMILYVHLRYGDELNLKLGNTPAPLTMGNIDDILQWHCMYPVSDAEIRRNDQVYLWQKNRNPFVDCPMFVDLIWGVNCYVVEPTSRIEKRTKDDPQYECNY